MFLIRPIIAALTILSLTAQSVLAVSYPSTGPSGTYAGGAFGTYLQNLFTNPCPSGQAVVGFSTGTSNYGEPICSSVGLAGGSLGDTLRFDGSNWVANSVIYNDGTNVGIGNTGPATKLDVTGVLTVNPGAFGDAVNFYNGYKIRTVGGGGIQLQGSPFVAVGNTSGLNGATFSVGNTGAAILTLYPDVGQSGFEISGYDFAVDSNGSLGIGTITPNGKLEIASTTDNAIRIDKTGGTNWSYMEWLYGGARKYWQGMNAAGHYTIQSDTSTGRIFLSGSLVSIGVSNPGYRLDVAAGYVNSESGFCIAGSCIGTWTGVSAYITGTPGYLARYDNAGNIAAADIYATGSRLYVGDIEYILSGSMSEPGNLSIYSATPSSSTNPMISLGQPGFPDCKIWVNGSSVLESNCSFGVLNTSISLDPYQFIRADAYGTGLAGSVMYESGSNVGIGTNAPGARLEVAGQIKITGGSPGTNKVLTSDASGLATWQTPGSISFTGVASFNSRTGVVIGASGDYTAGQITNVPSGTISATNLQAAINELATEKQVTITGAASSVTLSNLLANAALVSDAGGKIDASATISSTELGYLDNVASNIQTQIDGKEPVITAGTTSQYWRGDKTWQTLNTAAVSETSNLYYTNNRVWAALSGAISPYLTGNLTASRAIASDVNGKLSVANTTLTELNFVNGVTSSIQTQLNTLDTNKADLASPNFTGIPTAPTAATGTNTTQVATTAFVNTAITNGIASGALVGNFWYLSGNSIGANDFIGSTNAQDLIIKANNIQAMRVTASGYVVVGSGAIDEPFAIYDENGVPLLHFGVQTGGFPYNPMWSSIGLGQGALGNQTSTNRNIAIGLLAIGGSDSGDDNIAIGTQALNYNTGSDNIAIGDTTLSNNLGNENVAVGRVALYSNLNGSLNTALGSNALFSNTSGSFNTTLGGWAGSGITTGSNNIAIGYNAQVPSNTASNQLSIGNWIYGSGGNIGIGQSGSLSYRLVVAGTGSFQGLRILSGASNGFVLTSDASGNARWAASVGNVSSVFGRTGAVVGASGDYTAGQITNVPSGNIAATNVQAALSELDTEKQVTITGAASSVTLQNLTADFALVSSSTGKIATSATISATELGYLDNATSNIQTQINNKLNSGSLSGTANYVPKFNGTNSVTNSQIFDNGTAVGIGTASPGSYKLNVNGNTYIAGDLSLTGRLYVDTIVNRTVTNVTVSGGLIPDSAAPLSVRELGTNATRWNNLYLSGQITIGGGSPGVNKVLVSDANGLATWTSTSSLIAPFNGWTLSGNSVGANDFIGTTNDQDIVFKRNNVQIGRFSTGNTVIGLGAFTSNTSGTANIAIGSGTLRANTIGTNNVAVGTNNLRANTSGIQNTAIGDNALSSNTTGLQNTAIGASALATNSGGQGNVGIGYLSLYTNSTGGSNVAIGDLSLWQNVSGNYNVAIGVNSTRNNTTGGSNVAVGRLSLFNNITASGNTAIGEEAMYSSTGIGNQTALGYQSLRNVVGSNGAIPNTAIGYQALYGGHGTASNNTAYDNVALGYRALYGSSGIGSTGYQNVAVGNGSLQTNTSGFQNTAVGVSTLNTNTGGWQNTAIGFLALGSNTSGSSNTAIGYSAMLNNSTGGFNTAVGFNSLRTNTVGVQNTSLGVNSLYNTTGNRNIAIGYLAGSGITTGSSNIAIGYNAQVPSATSSNQLSIGDWIYGSGGNIGIGHSGSLNDRLVVAGTGSFQGLKLLSGASIGYVLTSDASGNARWAPATGGNSWSLSGNSVGANDFIGSTNARDVVIRTNNTERLRISSAGNILGMTYSTALGNLSSSFVFGSGAGESMSGIQNIALGTYAGYQMEGIGNTAIGGFISGFGMSGSSNTTLGGLGIGPGMSGFANTAVGGTSGGFTMSGTANVALGGQMAGMFSSGTYNVYIGGTSAGIYGAGENNTSIGGNGAGWLMAGTGNTAIGGNNPGTQMIGMYNTALGGISAGEFMVGQSNVAIGGDSVGYNLGGTFNVALGGNRAGQYMTGTYNVALGSSAGSGMAGQENVYIGTAAIGNNNQNNQFSIGNIIYGSGMGTSGLTTGRVGIGTYTPTSKLDVVGTGTFQGLKILSGASNGYVLTSDASGNARWAATSGGNVTSVFTRTGDVIGASGDYTAGQITNVAAGNISSTNVQSAINELDAQIDAKLNSGSVVGTSDYLPKFNGTNSLTNSQVYDNGTGVAIGSTSPGSYKLHVNGDSYISGSLTIIDKLYVDSIVNRNVTNLTISGNILPDTNAPLSYRDIGSNSTRWNNLYLSGQITIGGGSPGSGKILTSDANGLATWTSTSSLIGPNNDWSLSGNSIGANDFIGTTNDQDLILKRNNTQVARFMTGGNLALGDAALSSNTTGTYNVAIGSGALRANTTGNANTAIGNNSLYANTTGLQNIAIGLGALSQNTGSSFNIAIGTYALEATKQNANIAIGTYALRANIDGYSNLAIGMNTLQNNTYGVSNIAIGDYSLTENTVGIYNTAIGVGALWYNTGGTSNTAIGSAALQQNKIGTQNTAIGSSSLVFNTTGIQNTAIGVYSLFSNTTGNYNTAIGRDSLYNSTGSQNVALGHGAGFNITSGSNNIVIGYGAQVPSNTASNQLNIGNWIYGSGGNIGLGTSAPTSKLYVVGTGTFQGLKILSGASNGYVLTSDGSGNARWAQATGGNSWSLSGNAIGANDFIGSTNAQPLIIRTNNLEKARFYSSATNNAILSLTGGGISITGSSVVIGNTTGNTRPRDSIDMQFARSSPTQIANATGTTVIGAYNTANAISPAATVMGYANTYTGGVSDEEGAIVLGSYNDVSSAYGPTVVLGMNNVSNAEVSTTILGSNNYVPDNSNEVTIVGEQNSVYYHRGQVFGLNNTAGEGSVVIGSDNLMSEAGFPGTDYNVALGIGNRITTDIGVPFITNVTLIGLNNTGSAQGAYVFGSGITNSSNGSIQIGTSDAGKITLLSSGALGIGTSTPGAKLDVRGSAGFSNFNPALGSAVSIDASNYDAANSVWYGNALTIDAPYAVNQEQGMVFTNEGNVPGAAINFYTSDTTTYGRGGLKFKTSNSGTGVLTRLNINANGNIGIGIDTATSKLDVVGTGTFQGLKILSGASNGYVLTSDASGNARWAAAAGSSNAWTLSGNAIGANDFIGSTNDRNLIFTRSGSRVGFLGNDGNIGWGFQTLQSLSSGIANVAIGWNVLNANTSGNWNTAIGNSAMFYNSTGSYNVAVGYAASSSCPTCQFVTAVGNGALQSNQISGNSAFGNSSLYANTIGAENTALGDSAALSNTSGNGLTAVGRNSLYWNSTGSYNTALGVSTLENNYTGSYNNIIGYHAARLVGYSDKNTAIGYRALYGGSSTASENIGNNNVAIGYAAMDGTFGIASTGNENVAVGNLALASNTNGSTNTAIGHLSLTSNTSGYDNVAVGQRTLSSNDTGYENTALGFRALEYNVDGISNTAIGGGALWVNTSGSGNTANGRRGLYSNTLGSYNTANGYWSLYSNTGGSNHTALGAFAAYGIMAAGGASPNTAIGAEALYGGSGVTAANTAYDTIAIGYQALKGTTGIASTGYQNVAIGNYALVDNTSGFQNVAIGHESLGSNTTGDYNTSIGYQAMLNNTLGDQNTALGIYALRTNTGGLGNTSVGRSALYNSTSNYNTAVGLESLISVTTGGNNAGLGYRSLYLLTSGSNNTALGTDAGYTSNRSLTGSNNTFIGYNTTFTNTGITNATAIGANSIVSQSNTVILGTGANVGIGTSTPGDRLVVVGTGSFQNLKILSGASNGYVLTSDTNGNARWAAQSSSNGWSLSGNAIGANDFVGTTNNTNLIFKRNSSEKLRFDIAGNMIGIGGTTVGVSATNSIVLGSQAGIDDVLAGMSGDQQVALGGNFAGGNMGGSQNVAIGGEMAGNGISGTQNVAIGGVVSGLNSSGNGNVFLGGNSVGSSSTAVSSVFIGGDSAGFSMAGAYNIAIGTYAGKSMSGSNNIYIGSYATGVLNGNDQFSIGNVIYGTGMGTGGLANGRVGIGTYSPTSKLDVVGTGTFQGLKILSGATSGYVLTSDASGNARWAAAGSSTDWSLSGNAIGVNDFIGSTNGQDVVIKANNVEGLRLTKSGNILGLGGSTTPNSINSVVIGTSAGFLMSGSNNIVLGLSAGNTMQGSSNVAIGGAYAGNSMSGMFNAAFGGYTAGNNLKGSYNTALGGNAAGQSMSGNFNVAIGTAAGTGMLTGQDNIYIGSYAIGNAGQSNQFSLGNVIYGSGMGAAGTTNGMVGIGTMTPSQKLEVSGNVLATSYMTSSDRNLKENIIPLPDALAKILSIRGYSFDWKKDGRSDIGIIAQDVEAVYPEIVHTNPVTGTKSVEYGNLVAPMIEAMREQQSMIEQQQREIDELKSTLSLIQKSLQK